ncbi:MAG: hypothetical protein WCO56_04585 [Verrucomicrobiota bacterium]
MELVAKTGQETGTKAASLDFQFYFILSHALPASPPSAFTH